MSSTSYCDPPLQLLPTWLDAQRSFKGVQYTSLSFSVRLRGNLIISLLATCLAAVLFQPLRNRLQRGVNHLMHGERDEPYKVLSRLGERLESTLSPDAVLPTVVQTVKEALKLPYVAI